MLIDLFPITLHLSEVKNHNVIKKLCLNYVEKEYEKNPSTFVDAWDADVFTTYGKNINFNWNDIFVHYEDNIKQLINDFGILGRPMITESWFNAYKENQNQEIHEHLPGHFSAIHYISYDQTHLPTIFINPYRQTALSNSPKFNSSDINDAPSCWVPQSFVKVKEGDLLIFPSFFEHKVPRQKSNNLRVTLSFNLNFV